jgi:4-amino-4-deoxy-L-arabinose transferase-like glycosyltransferase
MSDTESRRVPNLRAVRWARILLIVAGALAAWAIFAALTGGARYELGPVRLSSRNPTRPLLIALLFAAVAWRLAYEDWLELRLRRSESAGRVAGLLLVLAAAVATLAFGWSYGVRAAGGSDQFGYVSQSALIRHGHLKIDQRFATEMPWPHPEWAFAPLAYRPSPDGETMVPTYPPGLSLLMAGARMISPCLLYYIAPVCGALLVVFTYLIGRRFFSSSTGVVAAVLTASSPTVLYMSLLPMSDVPAAACWVAALLMAAPSSVGRALAAGVLTGLAVAIRPNLVPLALFPWLLTLPDWRDKRRAVVPTLAFAAGTAPFIGFVAWINAYLHGSPFTSGYGSLLPGFAVDHAMSNLSRYPRWWLESQGVLTFLFLACLFRRHAGRRREAIVLLLFSAAVFLCYLFYMPFDAWWFLRFLLPAIPFAFIFCADAVQWLTSRFSQTVRLAALLAFTVVATIHAVGFSRDAGISTIGEGEQKYVETGVFVDRVTPPDAVIVSVQHGGSIRYYSGRLTLRFDAFEGGELDRAIEALEGSGRPVYLLLEGFEVPRFRERFAGQRALASLDRGPVATGRAGHLLFYTFNAAPFDQSSPRIPRISRRECRDMSPGFMTAGRRNAERPIRP